MGLDLNNPLCEVVWKCMQNNPHVRVNLQQIDEFLSDVPIKPTAKMIQEIRQYLD